MNTSRPRRDDVRVLDGRPGGRLRGSARQGRARPRATLGVQLPCGCGPRVERARGWTSARATSRAWPTHLPRAACGAGRDHEPLVRAARTHADFWSQRLEIGLLEEAAERGRSTPSRVAAVHSESGAERSDAKFEGLLALARTARARGAAARWAQNHVSLERLPDARLAGRALRRIAGPGLEVQVTEMDVSTTSRGGAAARAVYARQADDLRVGAACNEVPGLQAVHRLGRRRPAHLDRTEQRPLLFDSSYAAKPALDARRPRRSRRARRCGPAPRAAARLGRVELRLDELQARRPRSPGRRGRCRRSRPSSSGLREPPARSSSR